MSAARALTYNESRREANAKHLLRCIVSELGGAGVLAAPPRQEARDEALHQRIEQRLVWLADGTPIDVAEFVADVRAALTPPAPKSTGGAQ